MLAVREPWRVPLQCTHGAWYERAAHAGVYVRLFFCGRGGEDGKSKSGMRNQPTASPLMVCIAARVRFRSALLGYDEVLPAGPAAELLAQALPNCLRVSRRSAAGRVAKLARRVPRQYREALPREAPCGARGHPRPRWAPHGSHSHAFGLLGPHGNAAAGEA
eukprot:363899-Chlamydomonas_euryale.AAC.6